MNVQYTTRQYGIALVEMMIAMTLGLLVILGASNIFIANNDTFRSANNLAGAQENGRIAFELLSRDLRETGSNPCGGLIITNALNPVGGGVTASNYWLAWNTPVQGYDNSSTGDAANGLVPVGTAPNNRLAGTDAILTVSASTGQNIGITSHNVTSATLKLNSSSHGFNAGDILLACDYKSASVFQATNVSGDTIVHNSGTGTPGNCTKGLGWRDPSKQNCTKPNAYAEDFSGGTVVSFDPAFWYIGRNSRGGSSLFRYGVRTNTFEEMVENITNMQITYLMKNTTSKALATSYVSAASITDWTTSAATQAVAARITLTATTADAIDTSQTPPQKVTRDMFTTIQFRARESI